MHKVHLAWGLWYSRRQVGFFATASLELSYPPWVSRSQKCPRAPSCLKADPQMVTIIAKFRSKPGSTTSQPGSGCPLGRCTRLPLLRSKCQFWRQNGCPPVKIISANSGHSYQLFLSSSPGNLPEWERNSPSHTSKSLSFPLASRKLRSLCRYSACTLSLRSPQPDVTQTVHHLPAAIPVEGMKTKTPLLASKNNTHKRWHALQQGTVLRSLPW